MPVGTHEISFDYKHSLRNWEEIDHCRHLNLFINKKIRKQSDFSNNVFERIKCTGKNVFRKNGSYFTSK